jgi:hypothetical protein
VAVGGMGGLDLIRIGTSNRFKTINIIFNFNFRRGIANRLPLGSPLENVPELVFDQIPSGTDYPVEQLQESIE